MNIYYKRMMVMHVAKVYRYDVLLTYYDMMNSHCPVCEKEEEKKMTMKNIFIKNTHICIHVKMQRE